MKNTETLKKNYEFKNVLNKGSFYSGKYIQAFILKNNKSLNYIGLSISENTANAVTRNDIKRLLRENYMNFEEDLKAGYSIVFLWNKKANIEDYDFYKIKEDMNNIFRKSKIMKREE